MTEAPVDIITAIEGYLAKSGKGNTYLAKKLTDLFESDESPLNPKGRYMTMVRKAIEDLEKAVESMSSGTTGFVSKLETATNQLGGINSFDLSGMFGLMEKATTEFTDSMNLTKGYLGGFAFSWLNVSALDLADTLDEMKLRAAGMFHNASGPVSAPPEAAISSKSTIDVNVVSIKDGLIAKVLKDIGSVFTPNNKRDDDSGFIKSLTKALEDRREESEDSGIIGTILKGIMGVTAVIAGIGFIAKFLETPLGQKILSSLEGLKDQAWAILKPYVKQFGDWLKANLPGIMEGLWEGFKTGLKIVFVKLPGWAWDKMTGLMGSLKEEMGPQFQGVAVMITKAISGGLWKGAFKLANVFSFGLTGQIGKLFSFIMKPVAALGEYFSKMGGGLIDDVVKFGAGTTGVVGKFKAFFGGIAKYFTSGGVLGKLTTPMKAVSKLMGGGLLKILGNLLKGVAKRIPFIGALISFKDAYDRFSSGDITGGLISIGSGIASTFPGVGTAISIGLDVLNAFLDSKSETSGQGKASLIGNFIGGLVDKLIEGVKTFFGGLIDMIWNGVGTAKDAIVVKAKSIFSGMGDIIDSGWNMAASAIKGDGNVNIKINDGAITNGKLVQPSSKDQVIAMQTGGPFDLALKDMVKKLDMVTQAVVNQGMLISQVTMAGSQMVTQAVQSSGKGSSSPAPSGISTPRDPIGDYRIRAQRAIDLVAH